MFQRGPSFYTPLYIFIRGKGNACRLQYVELHYCSVSDAMFGPLRSSHLYILSFCVFWVVWAIQIQLSPDPFWTICFCEVLSKCSHALLISWALLSFSGEKRNCLTLITCLKCRNIALYCINGSLWTYYLISHTTSFILTRHRRTSQLCTNNGILISKI